MEAIPHDQQARHAQLREQQKNNTRRRSVRNHHQVYIKKLHPEAVVPSKSNKWDAGFDIYAIESRTIFPGMRRTIPTGISMEIARGHAGLIWPRSGLRGLQIYPFL